ncbi:MAG: DUF1858 domain-containing protein [Sedimentisphaerales bacterium]|nr:DUF1858 domain-containing protein [Sedimentisphaerales bacterium]
MTSPEKPPITSSLRVGELLDAYPELEQVLVDLAPPFRKLRHPVLRRTVAQVTTLRRAAQVAGVELPTLIQTLRRAAGQRVEDAGTEAEPVESPDTPLPAWVNQAEVVLTLDADEMLVTGAHPLARVQQVLRNAAPHQAVCIEGSFRPAPLIDLMQQNGCEVHVSQVGPTSFRTWIRRGAAEGTTT